MNITSYNEALWGTVGPWAIAGAIIVGLLLLLAFVFHTLYVKKRVSWDGMVSFFVAAAVVAVLFITGIFAFGTVGVQSLRSEEVVAYAADHGFSVPDARIAFNVPRDEPTQFTVLNEMSAFRESGSDLEPVNLVFAWKDGGYGLFTQERTGVLTPVK